MPQRPNNSGSNFNSWSSGTPSENEWHTAIPHLYASSSSADQMPSNTNFNYATNPTSQGHSIYESSPSYPVSTLLLQRCNSQHGESLFPKDTNTKGAIQLPDVKKQQNSEPAPSETATAPSNNGFKDMIRSIFSGQKFHPATNQKPNSLPPAPQPSNVSPPEYATAKNNEKIKKAFKLFSVNRKAQPTNQPPNSLPPAPQMINAAPQSAPAPAPAPASPTAPSFNPQMNYVPPPPPISSIPQTSNAAPQSAPAPAPAPAPSLNPQMNYIPPPPPLISSIPQTINAAPQSAPAPASPTAPSFTPQISCIPPPIDTSIPISPYLNNDIDINDISNDIDYMLNVLEEANDIDISDNSDEEENQDVDPESLNLLNIRMNDSLSSASRLLQSHTNELLQSSRSCRSNATPFNSNMTPSVLPSASNPRIAFSPMTPKTPAIQTQAPGAQNATPSIQNTAPAKQLTDEEIDQTIRALEKIVDEEYADKPEAQKTKEEIMQEIERYKLLKSINQRYQEDLVCVVVSE